jgi:hypothetical protein
MPFQYSFRLFNTAKVFVHDCIAWFNKQVSKRKRTRENLRGFS